MSAHSILDFSQDLSGADRHRLTSLYGQPPYVKQASHDQLCGDIEDLPQHLFALPTRRLYCCHTKAATWMSALYFGDKEDQIDEPHRSAARAHILKAAGAFGILGEVSELMQAITKKAGDADAMTPDSDYALVWTSDAGTQERHYPLRNGHEVKAAATWFAKYRDQFTYPDRRVIAGKILDHADIHSVLVPEADMLAKTAGWGACGAETLAQAWKARAELTQASFSAHSKQATVMAGIVMQNPTDSRQPHILEKMANLLDQFDRATKLAGLYDKGLERPEETLFQVTAKAASDFRNAHVQLVTGNIYEKKALADILLPDIRNWLGTEVADAVKTLSGAVDGEKLAEVLSVLPRNDAAMFDRMAASLHLHPAVVEKAAATSLLSEDDLAGLRQVYLDARKALQLN